MKNCEKCQQPLSRDPVLLREEPCECDYYEDQEEKEEAYRETSNRIGLGDF